MRIIAGSALTNALARPTLVAPESAEILSQTQTTVDLATQHVPAHPAHAALARVPTYRQATPTAVPAALHVALSRAASTAAASTTAQRRRRIAVHPLLVAAPISRMM